MPCLLPAPPQASERLADVETNAPNVYHNHVCDEAKPQQTAIIDYRDAPNAVCTTSSSAAVAVGTTLSSYSAYDKRQPCGSERKKYAQQADRIHAATYAYCLFVSRVTVLDYSYIPLTRYIVPRSTSYNTNMHGIHSTRYHA